MATGLKAGFPIGAGRSVTQAPAPERQTVHSWGRYSVATGQTVVAPYWPDRLDDVWQHRGPFLPFGLGRSYGDSCLNSNGVLIDTSQMRRLIAFDDATGVVRCEAGTTLADLIEFGLPKGWFLPTTPGTKFVTVGGAIANDVHGKNHHVAGTFGRHVPRFELLRSSGERLVCSADENAEVYNATIGGLGLTGLITWADVRLKPVSGPFLDMESIRFGSLDAWFEVSAESDEGYEYTMSFIDCMAPGRGLGRGLFMRGNHSWQPRIPGKKSTPAQRISIPLDVPSGLLTPLGVRVFNSLLYYKQIPSRVRATVPFDPFFYPLDSIGSWNRLYGERGFLQHQSVVPHSAREPFLKTMLKRISSSGEAAFLAVLKNFGDLPSPGMLSFPRPGVTLALDFPFKGQNTLRLLDTLDDIVIEYGGAVYPAKDARMSPRMFEASFPNWREFAPHVDERFSSSFWRRVTGS